MDTARLKELSEEVNRLCEKEAFRKKWKALTHSAFAKHAMKWKDFELSAMECTSILLEEKLPAERSLNELFSFLSFATAHTRFKDKLPENTSDISDIRHFSMAQQNEPLL
jgi:hypothetical protein